MAANRSRRLKACAPPWFSWYLLPSGTIHPPSLHRPDNPVANSPGPPWRGATNSNTPWHRHTQHQWLAPVQVVEAVLQNREVIHPQLPADPVVLDRTGIVRLHPQVLPGFLDRLIAPRPRHHAERVERFLVVRSQQDELLVPGAGLVELFLIEAERRERGESEFVVRVLFKNLAELLFRGGRHRLALGCVGASDGVLDVCCGQIYPRVGATRVRFQRGLKMIHCLRIFRVLERADALHHLLSRLTAVATAASLGLQRRNQPNPRQARAKNASGHAFPPMP